MYPFIWVILFYPADYPRPKLRVINKMLRPQALAMHKCIEEGVNHMWTVSAVQLHPRACIVCDEDATLELRVKTVKYFKGLMRIHNEMLGLTCSTTNPRSPTALGCSGPKKRHKTN